MADLEVASVYARLGYKLESFGARQFENKTKQLRAETKRDIVQKIRVDSEKADAKLAQIDKDLERRRHKADREGIVIQIGANIAGLRKDLDAADKVVADYDKRIADRETQRNKILKDSADIRKQEIGDRRKVIEIAQKQADAESAVAKSIEQQHLVDIRRKELRIVELKQMDERTKRQSAELKRKQEEVALEKAQARDEASRIRASEIARNAVIKADKEALARDEQRVTAQEKAAEKEASSLARSIRGLQTYRKQKEDLLRIAKDELATAEESLRLQREKNLGIDREVQSAQEAEAADRRRAAVNEKLQRDKEVALKRIEQLENRNRRGGRGGVDDDQNRVTRNLGALNRGFTKLTDATGLTTLRTSLLGISGSLATIIRLGTVLEPIFESLAGVVAALAGSLSAAAAGAVAVGTGFAALLPTVGVLGLAISQRTGLIGDAWKAITSQELAAGHQAKVSGKQQETAADQVKNATDRVRAAKETLANAERDGKRAQEDLTEAHAKAGRELQDLRRDALAAALAEKGAVLSYGDAVANLERLQDEGASALDIKKAKLDIAEARKAASDAAVDRKRANEDQAKGTTTVRDAEERLADAKRTTANAAREVKRANEGVTQAQTKATESFDATTAAADTAAAKIALLSEEERKTLYALKAFQDQFHKILRPATDAIFGGVADALDNVRPLLGRYEGAFLETGNKVAGILRRASSSLAGPEWTRALDAFTSTTNRIIDPLANAIGSVFEIIRDVVHAARPFVIEFADTVESKLAGVADTVGDVGKTREVIRGLVEQTKIWGAFLGEVSELIFNIFKGGTDEGGKLVKRLTEVIKGWNTFLESKEGQERMKQFFKDSVHLLGDIARFIKGVYKGFKLVIDTVLGLGDAVGWVKGKVNDLLDALGPVGDFIRHLAGWLTPVVDLIKGLAKHLGLIGESKDGIEGLGKLFGIMAALKIFGLTKLFGTMLTVMKFAAGGGAIALGKVLGGKFPGGGGGPGGAKMGFLDLFKGKGQTFANPLYVAVTNSLPGGGPGPGKGPPVVVPGGGGGILGNIKTLGAKALRVGGRAVGIAGIIYAALDASIELEKKTGEIGENIDPLVERFDSLLDAPRGSKRFDELGKLETALKAAVKAGDKSGLKKIADQIDEISKSSTGPVRKQFRDLADDIREAAGAARKAGADLKGRNGLDETFKDVARSVSGNWDLLARNSKASTKDIRENVKSEMAVIKFRLGKDSADGHKALALNFKLAKDAIKRQMKAGVIETDDGMAAIRSLLRQELKLYGLTITQARNIKDHGTLQSESSRTPGHGLDPGGQRGLRYASGGWLGGKGMVGGDTIQVAPNTYAAAGEYHARGPSGGAIINRHQAPFVDMALAQGGYSLDTLPRSNQALPIIESAMASIGGLDNLFSAVTRPHMLAKGGRLGAVGAANRLEKAAFNYQWGGGHQGSPAPFGPMDCSGAVSYVLQNAGVNIPTMTSGQLAKAGKPGAGFLTVYANPEHTLMRIGKRFFGTSTTNPGGGAGWIDPPPGDDYLGRFSVRHFGAGDVSGVINIPNPGAKNGGQVGRAANRVLQMAARGATKMGNRAINAMGLGTGNDNLPNIKGAFNKARLAALWIKAGGPATEANTAAAVALAESSGRPGIVNSIGAGGLWQIHPPEPNYLNPMTNARIAVRKFRESGWRPWEAYTGPDGVGSDGPYRQFLARGGRHTSRKSKPKVKAPWGQGITSDEIPSYLQAMWGQATNLMGSPGPMPPVRLGGDTSIGYAYYQGDGTPGGGYIQISKAMLAAMARPKSSAHSYALQAAFHEFAHVQQDPSQMTGENATDERQRTEGGADAWSQWAAPQILRRFGIKYKGRDARRDGYPLERAWVKKNLGSNWWRRAQFRHMSGGRYLAGGGKYGIGTIKAQRAAKKDIFERYMGPRGIVENLQTEFQIKDRKFGQSEEIFIKDDGTIDEEALKRRARELGKLLKIREQIVDALDEAIKVAKGIVKTYKEIVKRLKASRKGTVGKERSGLNAMIAYNQEQADLWRDETIPDVQTQRRLAKLDVKDIQIEQQGLVSTRADAQAAIDEKAPTELDFIDAATATAALTPEKQDDIDAAQRLVDYWTNALAEALKTPDPRDDTEAASALGSALAALEEAKKPPDVTADQQAVIDQQIQAAFIKGRTEFISAATDAVLAAAGDPYSIGFSALANTAVAGEPIMGQKTAAGLAGRPVVYQEINTLYPGDSRTLDLIGRAATAGQSQQGGITSPRDKLGV